MTSGCATEMDEVLALVRRRSGLVFPAGRRPEVERMVHAAGAAAHVTGLAALRDRLRTDPALLDDLVIDLTVGETYFFRHLEQLALVRDRVIPDLVRRRRGERRLRVWSAGCASGEEAYTLAALLDQAGLLETTDVLGTDVSTRALAVARRGVYRARSVRTEGAELAKAVVWRDGDHYRVAERLRTRVIFRPLNLKTADYPSFATETVGMDLILCRNVMIYFDEETIEQVGRRLRDCLADGGWLVTGPSDPPIPGLEVVVTEAGVCYRRSDGDEEGPRFPFAAGTAVGPVPASDNQRNRQQETGNRQPATTEPPTAASEHFPLPVAGSLLPVSGSGSASASTSVSASASVSSSASASASAAAAAATYWRQALSALEGDDLDAAFAAARRMLYLDPHTAAGHLLLARVQTLRGDARAARRSLAHALELLAAMPADAAVEPTGERAAALREVAAADLAALGAGDDDRG